MVFWLSAEITITWACAPGAGSWARNVRPHSRHQDVERDEFGREGRQRGQGERRVAQLEERVARIADALRLAAEGGR